MTDAFGQSVAIDDTGILVGSSHGGGAGYLFVHGGGSTALAQTLPAAKGGNTFGVTVALSGGRAVVATRPFELRNQQASTLPTLFSDYSQPEDGAAFKLVTRFTEKNAQAGTGGNLGAALALSGDRLVAGGSLENGGRGEAFAFAVP